MHMLSRNVNVSEIDMKMRMYLLTHTPITKVPPFYHFTCTTYSTLN
jgi:hypothetical protein